jgi:REP element-mobilizing transposase RayT
MNRYERRLPHWDVIGQAMFVTFRPHDSLPVNRVFPPARMTNGTAFVAMDRILDSAAVGPRHLLVPEIAALVVAGLCDGCQLYELHSFVVMPNHVHVLVTPHVISKQWLGPLKGRTARQANLVLGLTGKPFWQEESYDHLVRSDEEFARIWRYIENNPVTAGLVSDPEEFRWSSATDRRLKAAAG